MKRLLACLVIMVNLVGCTGLFGSGATETPPLPSPTGTATFTPVPPPTETPTPTASPTITPMPSPTPTPVGFYQGKSGVSLVVPNGWSVLSDEENSMTIMDTQDLIFLGIDIENDATVANLPFDNQLNRYMYIIGQTFKNYNRKSTDQVTLADGMVIQRAVMEGIYSVEGVSLDMDIYLSIINQNPKVYYILVFGYKDNMKLHKTALTKLYKSISLSSPLLYGVDRSKSMVMLAYNVETKDFDPALQENAANSFASHIFSGLVRLSPQLQVEPDLAESWTVSEDGTVYTFTMRGGARFQSSKLLTARDVKYSWERACDPETGSISAETYLGDILGVKEKIAGEADEIEGLKVIDDFTLEVTLDSPKPYFLAKLTYPVSFVVDRGDVEAYNVLNWALDPNASGPYILKDYKPGEALVFERNPNYYAPAKMEYIVYLLDRAGTSLSYYQADDVDMVYLDTDNVKEIQNPDNPLHDELRTVSRMCTSLIQFNNTLPPMDDPNVRQAFLQAIDRDQLVEQFTNDLSSVAQAILPPGMPGYSQELTAAPFDPVAAKEALKQSEYASNMPKVVFTIQSNSTQISPFYEALLTMWRENLGVNVKVEILSNDDFLKSVRDNPGHMVSFSWCADYPDPENFLDVMFHTGNDFNLSTFSNPEIDALLEEARIELDTDRRLELYQQVEKALIEDYSTIPILNSTSYVLVKPYIMDFVFPPMFVPFVHLVWREVPVP